MTVPKITFPPSAVTWNSRTAVESPPTLWAASMMPTMRAAVMAMLPTTLDGTEEAGITPSALTALSKPSPGSTVSSRLFPQRPRMKAIARMISAASTLGMDRAII